MQQIPDGRWISQDGRWLWRDGRWAPLANVTRTGPFWFMSTPDWVLTLLLMGLIGLIPFVGSMDLYGYAIAAARNLRAGYRVLPPASFRYLGLGAPVFVLGLAWSLIVITLALVVGGALGVAAYGQTQDLIWAIALGLAAGATVSTVLSIPALTLLVPALEMADREGWAVFRIGKLVRHATHNWRATWYGVGIFLLWFAIYFGISLLLSPIPFGGLLASIAVQPLLAPMIAIPLARFNDPPAAFGNGAANALAAGLLVLTVLGLAGIWGVAVVGSSYVSNHPGEVRCAIQPGCAPQLTTP
jgi:hypothetical protein